MSEEETIKETEETQTAEDTGNRDKPQEITLVDKANAAAERLEKANERTAELIHQQEMLAAQKALGGNTEGAVEEEKPKEMSDEEYAKLALAGKLPEQKK